MENYQQHAKDFLKKLGIEFTAEFIKHDKHFPDDKEKRDIYRLCLKRGSRTACFDFGQSLNNSGKYRVYKHDNKRFSYNSNEKPQHGKLDVDYHLNKNFSVPTEYDLLATLTKYDPGTLKNFCDDFGYDTDSKKAEQVYNGVKEEYFKVLSIFSDPEMEELMEMS